MRSIHVVPFRSFNKRFNKLWNNYFSFLTLIIVYVSSILSITYSHTHMNWQKKKVQCWNDISITYEILSHDSKLWQ